MWDTFVTFDSPGANKGIKVEQLNLNFIIIRLISKAICDSDNTTQIQV